MQMEELEPGSTALVLGSRRDRRAFCLRHLAKAERSAAVVLPADPLGTAKDYNQLGGEAPLTVVLEGGEQADEGPIVASDVHAVDVNARSLPAVGEATVETLESGGTNPPADRLWLAGLPRLLERVSVQQIYRLLYILSKHVRQVDGIGLYALDASIDRKTARILRQPLDYEVTLASESDPEIWALAGQSADV